jgi:hypothetical protein
MVWISTIKVNDMCFAKKIKKITFYKQQPKISDFRYLRICWGANRNTFALFLMNIVPQLPKLHKTATDPEVEKTASATTATTTSPAIKLEITSWFRGCLS